MFVMTCPLQHSNQIHLNVMSSRSVLFKSTSQYGSWKKTHKCGLVGFEVARTTPDSSSVSCSGCEHGRWNCSFEHCPVDGGLSPWGSWSSCSLSCGGLGLKTRTRSCTQPAPAHGGRDCQGPRQETTYCQAPDCPGTELA